MKYKINKRIFLKKNNFYCKVNLKKIYINR